MFVRDSKQLDKAAFFRNLRLMLTIAFWNLARQKHLDILVELFVEYGVEILIVAEQSFPPSELCGAYSRRTNRHLNELTLGDARVRFYSVFPARQFQPIRDEPHYSIKEYRPLIGQSLLLVGVHLPSKLHQKESDQAAGTMRIAMQIEEEETRIGHSRTVVLGDFNMDPFEIGMINCDGMHGVMDRRIAEKSTRIVAGVERQFFYNPMWKLMGDNASEALGTYYAGATSYVSYFWHTFDQVLLRPSLLAAFREEELHVLQVLRSTSLLSNAGPGVNKSISDHLPILLKLNT